MYTTRYSTIDELTTEQPQQNHTQSSHLAAKLISILLNIIWIIFFKEIKFKKYNCELSLHQIILQKIKNRRYLVTHIRFSGTKSDCMILYAREQQPCIYDLTDLASNALKFGYT